MAQEIQGHGYNCKFVNEPPDSFVCKICSFVAKDPQQMDCCGKVYCRLCLTEHKLKHSNRCPQCKREGNIFNDKRVDRDVKALKVSCDNLDDGCQWVGELRSLEQHVQNCDYTITPCPKQCKKNNKIVKMLRKDLDNHRANECPRRLHQCPHCMEVGEYEERTTAHLESCPKVIVQCPNAQCQVSIPRLDITTHRSTCEYETVPCKYAEFGCEETHLRVDMVKHEKDYELHLNFVIEIASKQKRLNQKNEKLKQQVRQLKSEIVKLKEVCHTKFTFKVTSFTRKRQSSESFYSSPFYTSLNGYRLCINVEANGNGEVRGTHVSVFTCIMKGDNDESLTWPFHWPVTIKLLNQLEDKNHHTRTSVFPEDIDAGKRVRHGEMGEEFGHRSFIAHSGLDYNSTKKCQYLVNDTLFFSVSVNEPNYKPWLKCTNTD